MASKPDKKLTAGGEKQKPAMKKSIVRNVQVPIFHQSRKSLQDDPKKNDDNQKQQSRRSHQPSSRIYHEPRYNNILDLHKKLEDAKQYVAKEKEVQNKDLYENKEITNKLNFPPKQQIFKNLPPLDKEKDEKASKLFNDTKHRIKNVKSKNNSKEIDDLLKKLVALEYEERFLENREVQSKHRSLNGEDKFFELEKFRDMKISPANEKEEDDQFLKMNFQNCVQRVSKSDEFDYFIPMHQRPPVKKITGSGCKCFDEYYNNHSTC